MPKIQKYKTKTSIGFSLSKDFYGTVAVDLWEIDKTYTLIEHATKYRAAAQVEYMKKENIAEGIMRNWIKDGPLPSPAVL